MRKQALLNVELIAWKQTLQWVLGSTYKQNNPLPQVLADKDTCCLPVQNQTCTGGRRGPTISSCSQGRLHLRDQNLNRFHTLPTPLLLTTDFRCLLSVDTAIIFRWGAHVWDVWLPKAWSDEMRVSILLPHRQKKFSLLGMCWTY